MLLSDFSEIGNKLLHIRKRTGLTQAEVAEAAGLSDRTYADIERGTANMRVATLLGICRALQVTPNDLLTTPDGTQVAPSDDLFVRLEACRPEERNTALQLLSVYLNSLK